MNINVDFQMVCSHCGSLAITIENPESPSREEIVYCRDCGGSRGTLGALRDLAVLPDSHVLSTKQQAGKIEFRSGLVALHKELQSLRRKVQIAESRFEGNAGTHQSTTK
jgi:hypothetical protein